MKTIRQVRTISLLFALIPLAVSSMMDQIWIGLAVAVILTGIGLSRPAKIDGSMGKVLFWGVFLAGVVNLLWDAEEIWILLACIGALGYWDLDSFHNRLNPEEENEHTQRLVQSHLIRLGFACGISLGFCLLALTIRFSLNIEWAIILSLVFVLSLRFGYKSLLGKNKSD